MKELLYKGRYIQLYASIQEMPVQVFQDFNRYCAIEANIGGNMQSVDGHLLRIVEYSKQGKKEDLRKEVLNLRQNMAFVIQNVNPTTMAFASIVHSINGQKVTDRSEEGLQKIVEKISRWGVPYGYILQAIDQVKKNRRPKFRYFSQKKPAAQKSGNFSQA